MPSCIIWGCLRIFVEAGSRCLELYDKLKDQLEALETHLERLLAWEDLFGEHLILQKPMINSYINVIRFWRRVEKECKRGGTK